MMLCSLRSLLLAVIVLINCITWTASRHHYTHNVSGHRSRHRRQGKGLYLMSSYVIPRGEGTGWGDWGETSPCSRTCGGGVASQKRICLQLDPDGKPQCTGGDTKYFSCETQDCPPGSGDFRAEQCSNYNNVTYRGIRYKWKPYTRGPNPCELNCMPPGERFYYTHQAKVIDGTRCNDDSFDVCVNGTCQPVGCDMMLGSNAREDKCRRCRGNGKNCYTANGLLDTQDLIKGYNDMMLIPEGSTTIVIMEVRPSNNYLALRAKNGTFYLNGDYHIDFPRSLMIAGALWSYERSQQGFAAPDKLRCLGPITEPLYLSLLLQSENVGIEYEYSLPSERAPRPTQKYTWVHEDFTPCSATCGGGFQTRNVTCRTEMDLDVVDNALCDEGLKPPTNQTCSTDACPPQWVTDEWGPCSKRCGADGIQSRDIRCEKIIINGFSSIVADKECFDLLGPKPEKFRECNVNTTCPTWFTGPWKPCNKLYGEGSQTRQVVCYQKNGRRIDVLEDSECADEKPESEKSCIIHSDQRAEWVTSDWFGCDDCLSKIRTRTVKCTTLDRNLVDDKFCAHHTLPVLQEACDETKLPPCEVQWYASQWSKCSSDCGNGTQTRRVFCGTYLNDAVTKVKDELCSHLPKYNDTRPCNVPPEQCPSQWFAAPWWPCDKKCGGGEQYRRVMCLRGDQTANDCDANTAPESSQSCNIGPCNEDDIIPLDSKSTPIIDEEECDYDEDYSEVGLDFRITIGGAKASTKDFMLSDSPSTDYLGSGMDTVFTHDYTLPTDELFMTDDGSGSGFSSIFTDTTDTDITDTSDYYTTELTDLSSTVADASTVSEPSFSKSSVSDIEVSGKSSSSTERSLPTESISTGHTESLDTVTEETYSTETDSSTDSSETTETNTDITDVDESTGTYETTESANISTIEMDDTSSSESTVFKISETGLTESTIASETTKSEPTDSTETAESIITGETVGITKSEETSETGSTDSTIPGASDFTITETSESEVTESTVTDKTLGSESTVEIGTDSSSVSGSSKSTGIEETTVSGFTDSTITEETTVSGFTDSTITEETTVSGSTESTNTEETIVSGSTESTITDETTVSGSTETAITEETEVSGSSESTITENTTILGSSAVVDETSGSSSTDVSTETEETTVSGTTEAVTSDLSTITTMPAETKETTVSEEGTTTSRVVDLTTESGSSEAVTSDQSTTTISTETKETAVSEEGTTLKVTDTTTEVGSTEVVSTDEATMTTTEISQTITDEVTSTVGSSEMISTTTSGATEVTESTEQSTEKTAVSEPEVTLSTTAEASTTVFSTTESELTTVESTTSSIEVSTEASASTTIGPEGSTTESALSSTESTTSTEEFETTRGSKETTEFSTPTSTETGFTTTSEGTTTEESSVQVITTEKTTSRAIDWKTTLGIPEKPRCKPKKLKCGKTKYGCCPDLRTPAKGPFDEGCPRPKTCKESEFGCCPDELSPALGPLNKGCPVTPCEETLFGCCLSDNKTASEGNDQEGCPPPPPACESSTYGCCADNTEAKGPEKEGCPELSTIPEPESTTETVTESRTISETISQTVTNTESESTSEESSSGTPGSTTVVSENCSTSEFGCCPDNATAATGPQGEGCPCETTQFGCCPDGVSAAKGVEFEGCVKTCNSSQYGCCPDGKTPAHGPDNEGCCLLYAFGCCPDNYKPADGPHLEGCGCQYARFGCCPDNATIAKGPNNEGCGCQHTAHGCCPDRHTDALGPNYEGCGCHTYQFGCCDDGVTIAVGPSREGCDCKTSQYGCCGDGKTPASGPEKEGCDCATSEFGCCPDGQTEAKGHKFFGCSDIPENRQAACGLPTDRGSCRNFSVYWYYDLEYGGCSRFWYGGCEGNGNRFNSKEECDDVCVQPSPKDACKLPKVKGACMGYNIRWYYDYETEHCSQFIYGGCLGNDNNFDSQERCQQQCQPIRTKDQCSLPIDRGSCAGNFGRWGFNSETRRCEQFIWGGCEGNANRFSSEAACIQRCDPPGTQKPQCMEDQDVGNCTDKEPVWSFSQTENRCVPFYYSGCGGNGNRFESEQSCARTCPTAYVPDVCTMPAETGECADYRERWYFDTTEKICRRFYYGGCGGNGNNFATQLECEGRCSDVKITTTVQPAELRPTTEMCFLEKDPGPCTEMETRWVYDYKVGRCVTFEYGGCGGNQNNFPTEEYCQYYCKPAQDICQLPMLSGPCNDSLMRWFYDPSSDSCSQFTYGGCNGNDNRFDNRDDCERRCRTGPATEEIATTTSTTPTPSTTVAVDSRFADVLPSECNTSPSLEPCERSGQVWFFDSSLGECVAHDNLESGHSCRNTGVFPTQETCERSCGAFRNINVCRFSLDPGPCQNFKAKYYFDTTTGRCHEFAYGGCYGGPNRFSTMDECLQVCRHEIDTCQQDPEQGNCQERYVLWYYDRSRDECLQFIYGGCGGNDNRFETREDCEGKCRQKPQIVTTTTTTTTTTTLAPKTTTGQVFAPIAEECRTPDSLVPCGDNITVYYYDEATRRCESGQFGGCQYPNSFRTEEECERRCGEFTGINVCEATLDPGPCRASIPKFFWDPTSGSCQPYAYGGCGGSANRFSTEDECQEICGNTGPAAACLQHVSTGTSRCGVPSRRWHYSVAYADCIVFVYEGCDGTDNNFLSYEQCANLCKAPRHIDCGPYDDECLQLVCPFGMARRRTPEGCTQCSCVEEIADCEPMRAECEALRCAYGLERTRERNGCERCQCEPDPCLRQHCPVGENCIAIAQKDPITGQARFSATCKPRNDVLPDCDRFNDECSRLRCEYGIQRTRTVEGCERCTCVQVEIDCAPLKLDCDRLKCNYGIERVVGQDGCERCRCTDHPCANKECDPGDRCVATPFRDPITQESKYSAECRTVNKTGYCPMELNTSMESVSSTPCREECRDDADCRGAGKCCSRGCDRVCFKPEPATPPAPYTTTHTPDLPRAPEVSHETEPEVAATEGGKATLRCIFHGNPPPKITWRRGEITINSDVGRYRLLSNGALEIVSLYRNDSGVYICVAENTFGQARQEVRLQVNVPVRTSLSAPYQSLTAGSELSLTCEVDGYPEPDVYWAKDNKRIIPNDNIKISGTSLSRLTVSRLTLADAGTYECHARNDYSSHYSYVQINVQAVTIPPKCIDSEFFAKCDLIVRSKFCRHQYYSKFCCKSCLVAGQLSLQEVEMQADQPLVKRK